MKTYNLTEWETHGRAAYAHEVLAKKLRTEARGKSGIGRRSLLEQAQFNERERTLHAKRVRSGRQLIFG